MSRRSAAFAPSCLAIMLVLAGCAGGAAGPELDPGAGELPVAAERDDGSGGLARMGDTALRTGEAATAAGLFEQALARDGTNLAAAVGLGQALLSLGRPQDAGRAFERALAVDPNLPAGHYGYARAMMALRRPELAVGHLEAVLQRRPEDVQALNALGVAHDLLGRQDLAIAAYRRGLAVAPGTVSLRNNLGLSLALAGRFDEALNHLRPLGEGPQATRRTRQNLALVYALGGDVGAAQRLGRTDLSESELEANLAYVAEVRGLRNPGLQATALAPVSAAPGEQRTGALPEPAAGAGPPGPAASPVAAQMVLARTTRPAGLSLTPFFD